MYCWNCAHVVNDGEKKCPSCGASRKIKKGTKIHYCPNCGKSILGKEKCKYCGFDVILKKVVQEEEAVDVKETAPTESAPVKTSDDLSVDKQVPLQVQKSSSNKAVIPALFIAAIVLVGAGSFVLLNQSNQDSSNHEGMQVSEPDSGNDEESGIQETETEEVVTTEVVVTTTTEATTTIVTTTTIPKNHHYELVQGAVSWEEANSRAIAAGGRLAEVHSEDDWNKLIAAVGNTDVYFIWLGAKRTSDYSPMYWNSGDEVDSNWSHWYGNEPSYVDATNPSITEPYLLLWWLKDSGWSLNDANASAVLSTYKDYRIGYAIEYDY